MPVRSSARFKAMVLLTVLFALLAVSGQAAWEEATAASAIQGGVQQAHAPALTCFAPLVMGDIVGHATATPAPRNDINSIDALWILRRIVGQHLPLPGCSSEDMDCDGDRDAVDALWILRWIEYMPVYQHEPCPDIGTELH